jgi:hypothetical protein
MNTALIIAGYAAAVSTASVAWQVYQWREKRQVRVEIRLSLFEVPAEGRVEQRVGLRAVNRSERPVRWAAAELEPQDGSARRFFIAQSPANPVIAAHDSLDTWAARAELEPAGLELTVPVVAIVRLTAGEEFRSPPHVLAPG